MDIKISYKKSSIVALAIFMLVSLLMVIFSKNITIIGVAETNFVTGPRFYPIFIGLMMFIFCIISMIDVLKKPDEIIELKNIQKPIVILVIMLIWGLLWQLFGYFILISTAAITIIMYYLNPQLKGFKKARNSLLYSVVVMGIIYAVFVVFLKLRI